MSFESDMTIPQLKGGKNGEGKSQRERAFAR
jgi:hypothetical protein